MSSVIPSLSAAVLLTAVATTPVHAQTPDYLIQITVTGNDLKEVKLDTAQGNAPLLATLVDGKRQITIPAGQVGSYQDATLSFDFGNSVPHHLYLHLPHNRTSLPLTYINYDIKSCLRNDYQDITQPSHVFDRNLKAYMKVRQIYTSRLCLAPGNRKYFSDLWFRLAYAVAISGNGYAMDMDAYDALLREVPGRKTHADAMLRNIGQHRYDLTYSEMTDALKAGRLQEAAELNGRLPALLEKGNLTGAALTKERAKLASNQAYIATLQKAQ